MLGSTARALRSSRLVRARRRSTDRRSAQQQDGQRLLQGHPARWVTATGKGCTKRPHLLVVPRRGQLCRARGTCGRAGSEERSAAPRMSDEVQCSREAGVQAAAAQARRTPAGHRLLTHVLAARPCTAACTAVHCIAERTQRASCCAPVCCTAACGAWPHPHGSGACALAGPACHLPSPPPPPSLPLAVPACSTWQALTDGAQGSVVHPALRASVPAGAVDLAGCIQPQAEGKANDVAQREGTILNGFRLLQETTQQGASLLS